jgi:prepilin-type processing-associated H-X9-DG protein
MMVALKSLAQDGFAVTYADGHVRKCYPIIAGIMADYKEQVLITGIKKAQHYSICVVLPNERENLTKR